MFRLLPRPTLRTLALVLWALLLAAFWLGTRQADAGPLDFLLNAIDELSRRPWAPAGLLALYLLRPLLLVPVTILNLASGLLLGLQAGLALAITGTLLSATVGYGIGRFSGSPDLTEKLSSRWPLVRTLRRRSFETVVAGGLMYLHADMVNLPAGLLRIHFPTFLIGITFGNALTLSTAVLAGASVEGGLRDAKISVEPEYLVLAAALFLVSLALAYLLRRRLHLPQ
ncbi:MAG: VTT domain-containing protein [Trueperaceae bacterium]